MTAALDLRRPPVKRLLLSDSERPTVGARQLADVGYCAQALHCQTPDDLNCVACSTSSEPV